MNTLYDNLLFGGVKRVCLIVYIQYYRVHRYGVNNPNDRRFAARTNSRERFIQMKLAMAAAQRVTYRSLSILQSYPQCS